MGDDLRRDCDAPVLIVEGRGRDPVFGVREDRVMPCQEMPAGSFPEEGFALSGKMPGE